MINRLVGQWDLLPDPDRALGWRGLTARFASGKMVVSDGRAGPAGSAPGPQVSGVEECGQGDQRDVDGGQVAGEPPGQVNVGDRAPLGAQPLGDLGERAAEPVPGEDQRLRRDHTGGNARAGSVR